MTVYLSHAMEQVKLCTKDITESGNTCQYNNHTKKNVRMETKTSCHFSSNYTGNLINHRDFIFSLPLTHTHTHTYKHTHTHTHMHALCLSFQIRPPVKVHHITTPTLWWAVFSAVSNVNKHNASWSQSFMSHCNEKQTFQKVLEYVMLQHDHSWTPLVVQRLANKPSTQNSSGFINQLLPVITKIKTAYPSNDKQSPEKS